MFLHKRKKTNLKQLTQILRLLLIVVFSCLSSFNTRAQDSTSLHISILTCGVGQELYSVYGHSAIRILDRANGTDIVYNYGTFNFGDPDFYAKFTRGKLPYYLNAESFLGFVSMYEQEGRSVYEQVLQLSPVEALKVKDFLTNNLKPEHKYYHYDFLFDNCSTRIRDIFTTLFGKRFQYGYAMTSDSISFRTLLDHYERNLHWERFGINLLLSNLVDQKMSNEQSMFIPDYLMKGFQGATLDGKLVVKETLQLVPEPPFSPSLPNQPRMIFWGLFLTVLLVSFLPQFSIPLRYFDIFLFMILGLLGFFMMFMWFGTEHKVCAWNRNLLWAFPLHLIFAFLIPRQSDKKAQYARYMMYVTLLSLLYNSFAIQKFGPELTPLILLILYRLSRHASQFKMTTFKQFSR